MKTLMSYVALTALILTSSFTIHKQQELNTQTATSGCFNYFRIHRQAHNVAMSWAVNTPDVAQFSVERSYDGEFFENAGSVGYNGGSAFKFTDESPFPGTIFYRIKAIKTDGTSECSSVVSIRVVQH